MVGEYLPIENSRKCKKDEEVKLYDEESGGRSINLNHLTTFDKLAIDPEARRVLLEDLDRFVKSKEFYI